MAEAERSESQSEFVERVRRTLVGHVITAARLRRSGISPASKGKWGQYNERLLGKKPDNKSAPDFGSLGELKTTVRDRDGAFRESIKICMDSHDPMDKLGRTILVIARDVNDAARLDDRVVRNEEVVLLEPTSVLRHALLRDIQLLRKDRHSKETYFLERRTAGAKGLGGQVKSGQTWTGQNRPTARTQDQFASTPRRLRPATSDAFASFAARI